MSDQDNDSGVKFMWRAACFCFCFFIASVAGCNVATNANDNAAIVDMVKAGSDPLSAKCAVRPNDASPMCAITAARK